MKALDTYTEKFSGYEKERGENAYSGEFRFLVEHFENIGKYFEDVDRDDILEQLQGQIGKQVSILKWSPLKLEAMHSLHLEKAMQIRYSSYSQSGQNSVLSHYVAAAAESIFQGHMLENSFADGITKWSSK